MWRVSFQEFTLSDHLDDVLMAVLSRFDGYAVRKLFKENRIEECLQAVLEQSKRGRKRIVNTIIGFTFIMVYMAWFASMNYQAFTARQSIWATMMLVMFVLLIVGYAFQITLFLGQLQQNARFETLAVVWLSQRAAWNANVLVAGQPPVPLTPLEALFQLKLAANSTSNVSARL